VSDAPQAVHSYVRRVEDPDARAALQAHIRDLAK
jgi:hypothetical protein